MKQSLLSAALAMAAVLTPPTANAASDLATSPSPRPEPVWRLSAQGQYHSDALVLADTSADDALQKLRARGDRNLHYLREELRLSRTLEADTWSLLARRSTVVVANRGAVELAHKVSTVLQSGPAQQWQLKVDYRHLAGTGLEWQREWAFDGGWQLQASVQGLALLELGHEHLDGQARYSGGNAGQYAFALNATRSNAGHQFPFQQPVPSNGWGVLSSGELSKRMGRVKLAAHWHDLGRLYWHRLPTEYSAINTSTQATDANGYLIYRPLIQGRNTQTRNSVAPPWWLGLQAELQVNECAALTLHLDQQPLFGALPSVAWTQAIGSWRWQARWHSYERRLALGLEAGRWRLRWGQGIGASDNHSLEFGLAYSRSF